MGKKRKKNRKSKVWADQGTNQGQKMEQLVKQFDMSQCRAQLFRSENEQPCEFLCELGQDDDSGTIQREYGKGEYAIMIKRKTASGGWVILAKKIVNIGATREIQVTTNQTARKLNMEDTSKDTEVKL